MADTNHPSTNKEDDSLVVGLGASAGGLQALKSFFRALPEQTGMAFIVIIHLSPEHDSNLAELLQAETSLKVQQVKERIDIEEDHVYVIPPNKLLRVGDDHIELTEPESSHHTAAIDLLFRTLGKVKKRHAAGVILSGAGSDGTVGIKTIKENGGLTIVQEPKEAQYTDMPWSAIDSGVADFVVPVEEMGKKLLNYKKSLSEISIPEVKDGEKKTLQKIFTRVRSQTGHDFSNYKRTSVLRRVERRMQVNRVMNLDEYLSYLQEDADEVDSLFKDLLISVTNFFRDHAAFDGLEKKVIPELFEEKAPDEQVRVWVPGCATGEEAYSMAILLQEQARQLNRPPEIQIFASDIDEAALTMARQGSYPDSIAADISPERLDRFFNHMGTQYQVKDQLKEMILFAPHNLLSDPPFSKLDLVACRNLLIYLNRELQSEVFNLFHYALRPQGYLFLGLSDSNLEASELFKPLDKKLRIYRRTPTSESHLRLPQTHWRSANNKPRIPFYNERSAQNKANYETLHRNLLARLYAPQSVIVNENYNVIHATDDINTFLEYAGGEPSHDILQMVKPELRQALQSLLYSAGQNTAEHLHKKTRLQTGDGAQPIEIIVHRISENQFSEGLIHVIFKEISPAVADHTKVDGTAEEGDTDEANVIINTLEQELDDTKEQLQITVEEYETSNEELRASNEELQSMNEELQSTTEELVTGKEELQSVNEELKTVNRELEDKVEKLNHANNDLQNLLEATEIGIVFVDRERCVQRFTSKATAVFNLIDSDMGRPLEHVTHRLAYDGMLDDVKQVLHDLKNIKKVVAGAEGERWYIARLRPYRTTEERVEGVVLTFVEISELKAAQKQLEKKARQEEALATLGLYALAGKEVQEVIHRAVQMVCEILQLDFSMLHAFNYEDETFELKEAAGPGFEGDCPEDVIVDHDLQWDVGFAFDEDDHVVVENYNEEKRFGLLPLLEDFDITSGMNMMIEGTDEAYGVLSAYSSEPHSFSEHDISFMQVVANLIGEAMDRKQSADKLETRNQQLIQEVERSKKFQREILNNSIVERWELGSYLHDNLAQTLVSAKMMLKGLPQTLNEAPANAGDEIEKFEAIIDEGIAVIRNLTHDIIPIDVEKEGVDHAFRFLVQQAQKLYGIHCTLQIEEIGDDITNLELATNLYLAVQEAVKNAVVHGEAQNIEVVITKPNGSLVAQVQDDGIGLSNSSKENAGRGLRIMQYRMELHGGTFAIEERSGSDETGTHVTFTIPMQYLMDGKD